MSDILSEKWKQNGQEMSIVLKWSKRCVHEAGIWRELFVPGLHLNELWLFVRVSRVCYYSTKFFEPLYFKTKMIVNSAFDRALRII